MPHGIFNKTDQTVKCFFWVSPTRKLYDLFWAIHSMKEQNPPEVVALSAKHEVMFLPPPPGVIETPSTGSSGELSRRTLLASGAALGLTRGRAPALARSAKAQAKSQATPKPVVLNDAGRLSPTPVAKHIVVRPNEDDAILAELRTLLKDAAAENRPSRWVARGIPWAVRACRVTVDVVEVHGVRQLDGA